MDIIRLRCGLCPLRGWLHHLRRQSRVAALGCYRVFLFSDAYYSTKSIFVKFQQPISWELKHKIALDIVTSTLFNLGWVMKAQHSVRFILRR